MEDLMFLGTGLYKSTENQVTEEPKETDPDVLAQEKAEAEVACEYLHTFENLSQMNADAKIRVLNRIKTNYSIIRDDKSIESLNSFIEMQSLEAGAAAEATGGENKSKGNKAKVDQSKLGEAKQSFFRKAWETIKRAFIKIFEWIKEKIEAFVGWIRGLFAKNDPDKVYDGMSDEEISSLESALEKFEFENQSEEDENGFIPLNEQVGKTFSNKTSLFVAICNQFSAIVTECMSTGYKPEGMTSYINKMIDTLRQNFHGIGDLPKIENANPEQIKKFNREVRTAAQHLTWNHDPVGYCKFFCGTTFQKPKGKKLTPADLYGTKNLVKMMRVAKAVSNELDGAKRNLTTAFTKVKKSADEFSNYLSSNKLASGNLNNDNFTINEQGNNVADGSKVDAEANYAFITSVQAMFNIICKLESIISTICAKMMNHCNAVTKCLSLKEKIKKGIKDIPGNAKEAVKGVKAKFSGIKTKFKDTINSIKNGKEVDAVQWNLLKKELQNYVNGLKKAGVNDADAITQAYKDITGMTPEEFFKKNKNLSK